MNAESIFKIVKCVGAALGGLASLVLACFGIRKEVAHMEKENEKKAKEEEA